MKYSCFKDSCKEMPDVFCTCLGEPEPMCGQHIPNHYFENQDKIHTLSPAFKRINSDLKDPAIEYFKKLIKKNNEMKKVVIEETQKILKISNQIVKYFEKYNKLIVFNIEQLLKRSRVILPLSKVNNTQQLEIRSIDELDQIKSKTIKEFYAMNVWNLFDLCYMKISDILKEICEYRLNSDEDELCVFKHNTNVFYKFYPKEEAFQNFTINSLYNQGFIPTICKIDKSNLFVYGGFSTGC